MTSKLPSEPDKAARRRSKLRPWYRDPRVWAYLLVIPFGILAYGTNFYVQLHLQLANSVPVTVDVARGESLESVVQDLRSKGVFANPLQARSLRWWARWSGAARAMRAGEYRIPPGTSPLGLLGLLSSNDVVLHKITFVDGWRFSQAWEAIANDPAVHHTLPANASPAQVMSAIGHPGVAAEGLFFPDTYRFPRGETDVTLLRRAYAEMIQRLAATWTQRASGLPFDTPYDALIMASLIEKETAQPDELARISGVFARRLQIGMRLQTDPSVIYGLGADFNGNLTLQDLKTDTPYNTYTRGGLPPTPICLPSQAALTAAVHPQAGQALYFVSTGKGTHVFSDTLAEQNAAVRRYQLGDHQ